MIGLNQYIAESLLDNEDKIIDKKSITFKMLKPGDIIYRVRAEEYNEDKDSIEFFDNEIEGFEYNDNLKLYSAIFKKRNADEYIPILELYEKDMNKSECRDGLLSRNSRAFIYKEDAIDFYNSFIQKDLDIIEGHIRRLIADKIHLEKKLLKK